MFKKFLLIASMLICASPIFAADQTTPYSFKRIVFFGDSLTDNGNLSWALPIIPQAPYYKGRFSNGPVWSEVASDYYTKKGIDLTDSNYAVGGETIYHHSPASYEPYRLRLPKTLWNSVDIYQDWTFYLTTPTSWYADNLYTIWIGGNDYMDGVYDGDANVNAATDWGVYYVEYNIRTLIWLGGRQFVLFTVPDLSTTPWSIQQKTGESTKALSLQHNQKLVLMVDRLKKEFPDLHVEIFDSGKAFDDYILKHKDDPKFNYKDACYKGNLFGNGPPPCDSPDNYVFWDTVHPTAKMHHELGLEFIEMVDEKFRKQN